MAKAAAACDRHHAARCTAAARCPLGSPLVLSRVHWVRPELVAEVEYLAWTEDNLLRQVVYEGLREDKPAQEVRSEVPDLKGRLPGPAKDRACKPASGQNAAYLKRHLERCCPCLAAK
jgi:hypothetical protein